MKQTLKYSFLGILTCMTLASCSSIGGMFDDEKPALEGERISVLELQKSLEPDSAGNKGEALIAPPAWQNEFWPQAGGYPNHSMQHLALGESPLAELWNSDIGDGATDEIPLTAQPIIVDGRIFTLDTDSNLTAFDITSGKQLWRTDVRDEQEDEPVIGGGIGFSNAVLYVTAGYDEIFAIAPSSGEIIWRKDMPAAIRAAPTIMDERVFVLTMDNRLLALDARDGSLLWEHIGLSESAGLIGAASPAANRDIVVPAFSSGELTALRVENGSLAWSDNLSNVRRMGGLESLSDIKALPVIDKGLVIAISFSGRLVAIDERTGTRVWQREIGGSQTPWIAGNHVFVISSNNELVALSRDTGSIHWVSELPKFEDPEDKDGKIIWYGPVMAGNRLILAGSHGRIIEVEPETGNALKELDLDTNISIAPIVAGGTLYILSDNGRLTAWQ